MGFASAYLEQRALFPQEILEAPDSDTGIIVVVPAYNEPDIFKLLDSLNDCEAPACKTEVIIVINAPEDAPEESIENNKIALQNIESWKKANNNSFFRLFTLVIEHPDVRGWGVGLARKTGMDEAIRRFNSLNKPDGVILSLDADCSVEKNYFITVFSELNSNKEHSACSIFFEHPLTGSGYPENIYKSITLYELHLRYYFQALVYSGFPYAFHTVGSAIAVKALTYIKAGGMNRKKAGEDFYFIQKLVPAGGYFSLNSTAVYPSPRVSSRVPFGTGASMEKLTSGNSTTLLTYNLLAFEELRTFFGLIDDLYKCGSRELSDYYILIPPSLVLYLDKEEWIEKMIEIKGNTSNPGSFKKRFFGWFNMFRIVKYLNAVHTDHFVKIPVDVSASDLLEIKGITYKSTDPLDLLLFYRSLERNSLQM
jgi:hypothetical protein